MAGASYGAYKIGKKVVNTAQQFAKERKQEQENIKSVKEAYGNKISDQEAKKIIKQQKQKS